VKMLLEHEQKKDKTGDGSSFDKNNYK